MGLVLTLGNLCIRGILDCWDLLALGNTNLTDLGKVAAALFV